MIITTRRGGSGGAEPSSETNQLKISWYGGGHVYVGSNHKEAEPEGVVMIDGLNYDVYIIPRGSFVYAVDTIGTALYVNGLTDYAIRNTSFFGFLNESDGSEATVRFAY